MNGQLPKILIIDDNIANRQVLNDYLMDKPYETQVAMHGQMALDMMAQEAPDLVVVNLNLEGMSGLEVLGAIRGQLNLPYIPVLVEGDRDSATDRSAAAKAGADGFLVRPSSCEEFSLQVKTLLKLKEVSEKLVEVQQEKELAELAESTDHEEWIENPVQLRERLKDMLATAIRHDRPLAIIVGHMEDYQELRKVWGSEVAKVMKELSATYLTADLRQGDVLGDRGTSEMLVILPETDKEGALILGRRLVEVLYQNPVALSARIQHRQQLSIGVADWQSAKALTLEELIAAANKDLKRNQPEKPSEIVIDEEEELDQGLSFQA